MIAFITGANGQDGSYLSEILLDKGYEVYGLKRRSSTDNMWRLLSCSTNSKFHLVEGDVSDAFSMSSLINQIKPTEVYHLAAQSHVATSFAQPKHTLDVNTLGTLNVLEACKNASVRPKVYFASTSETFGANYSYFNLKGEICHVINKNNEFLSDFPMFQREDTPLGPNSPYAVSKVAAADLCRLYRQGYGMYVACGTLMNHESPRRGEHFVTRKITKWIGQKLRNPNTPKLELGNLKACRDFGHSRDYCNAMWLILQQNEPDDFVIATGKAWSVEQFLETAFKLVDMNWQDNVVINKEFFRPNEVPYLRGDASKAKAKLGWEPKVSFEKLVEEMVASDIGVI